RSRKLRMIVSQAPVESPAGAAVPIVENEPVAAPPQQRFAANAESSPDLAGWRDLATKLADISFILTAVELDGVKVEQGRDVGDRSQRSIAEDSYGEHPRAPCATDQRRGSIRRDMAGAARHEDAARVRRWSGGANVGAAA